MQLRFVLVDARPTARAALREVVEQAWGWTVAAEARDGIEAIRLARQEHADVLLVDAAVDGINLTSLTDLLDTTEGPLVVGLLDFPHQYAAAKGVAVLKGAPSEHVKSVILDALAEKAGPGAPDGKMNEQHEGGKR